MSTSRGVAEGPDGAGKIRTVKGTIDPGDLGVTLMHEHLFIDARKANLPDPYVPATELRFWEAKVDMSNILLARERMPIVDNYLLIDEEVAVEEVLEFRKYGGKTVVDVTSVGLRRDPLALRRVSEATGLHIIMGSSWYRDLFYDVSVRTVEDLTEEVVRDITVGVGETGIRSGIIGEVGVEGGPLSDSEIKKSRAAARASRATGVAISFHRAGVEREKHQILDVVAEEGADLTRVILGHSDLISRDIPLLIELLERGVYIQFDWLGRVEAPLGPTWTHAVALAVPKLLDAGYEDRILLSQDTAYKAHLKRYGGTGYSFVLESFLPHLKTVGVSEAQINKLMVENPMRVLTLVEPQ